MATLTTPNVRQLAAEVLTCRVRHFTQGVIPGSRSMIDQWFEAHRQIVKGRSRTERKRGSKVLGGRRCGDYTRFGIQGDDATPGEEEVAERGQFT